MSALGQGVTLDAAATPLRIAFYDTNHADAQNDGNGFFEYNLHKIWACMGRAGVNGVMRNGFVEIGDPYNNAPAGWIESYTGGFWNLGNYWNTIVPYNPTGGLAAGDYTIYGTLEPHTDIVLHLDTPTVGQPPIAIEYWTGAAWAAHTVSRTPDFTQANGRAIQRLTISALPTNWASNIPAGCAAPVPYYFTRIYTTAPYAPGTTANINYKDWLEGHMQMFYCHYGLKRGEDTNNANNPTEYRHIQPNVLKFRDGFGWESRTTIISPWQMGDRRIIGREWTSMYPWVVWGGKHATIRGANLYGGMIAQRAKSTADQNGATIQGIQGASGYLVDMVFAGAGNGIILGGSSSAVLTQIQDVTVRKDPNGSSGFGPIRAMSLDLTNGWVVGLKIVGTLNDPSLVSSTIASAKIQGVRVIGVPSNVQLNLTGSGGKNIYEPFWGTSGVKASAGSNYPSDSREWWFCRGYVVDKVTLLPIIVPFRITDILGQKQADDLTLADGTTYFANLLPNAPAASNAYLRNRIAASSWRNSLSSQEETVLDPILIEVNPADHASYNPSYESISAYTPFPGVVVWDETANLGNGAFVLAPGQRSNMSWAVALGPPAVPAVPMQILTVAAQPLVVQGTERVHLQFPERA